MLRFRKEQEFLCDTFHFAFAEVYNSVFSESHNETLKISCSKQLTEVNRLMSEEEDNIPIARTLPTAIAFGFRKWIFEGFIIDDESDI